MDMRVVKSGHEGMPAGIDEAGAGMDQRPELLKGADGGDPVAVDGDGICGGFSKTPMKGKEMGVIDELCGHD